MCVILVCETKKPDLDTLIRCEETNNDGAGIAWRGENSVEYVKGITAGEIFKISQEKPLPQIIHFRLATVGKGELLCHPFSISTKTELALKGKAKKLLFHNGHWSQWKKYCLETAVNNKVKVPLGRWSDSRAMAWLASVYGESFLDFLEEKVVVFSKSDINLYGNNWVEKDGITFSNLNWECKYKYDWYFKKEGGKNAKFNREIF